MIFGLGAAFAWGAADFGVALLARRIGSFTTLVLAQLGGIVLFSALLATPVGSLPRFHPGLLILPLIGISGALSYVAFYRALELGPIALVSPIAAGYAAIVIALSLIWASRSLRWHWEGRRRPSPEWSSPPRTLEGCRSRVAGSEAASSSPCLRWWDSASVPS